MDVGAGHPRPNSDRREFAQNMWTFGWRLRLGQRRPNGVTFRNALRPGAIIAGLVPVSSAEMLVPVDISQPVRTWLTANEIIVASSVKGLKSEFK